MPAALQNHGKAAAWKTSVAYVQKQSKLLLFFAGDSNFADKTAPVLGSRNGHQNGGHSFSLNLICLCPDDLATPKRVPFVGKIFAAGRKIVQVSIVSAGTRQKFRIPLCHWVPHGFAAPRAIVLHALRTFMPTHVLELGRPTLATLESTAFLALGFGAVNGQDFRTRRDPLGRFTLFLISQLVSGSRVSLTQGRAGPAGVETAGREHGSCNHAVGE